MKRRTFVSVLGGAAACWGMPGYTQTARMRVIGVLVLGTPDPGAFLNALREGLRQAGYLEDRDIRLEIRSADGNVDRLPQRAAELVRLNVNVIVTLQTPAATAAKQATDKIPIVMAGVGDAVATGLVASLARPGGNVTGVTTGTIETAGNLVRLIPELFPRARRLAVLANGTDPFAKPLLEAIKSATQALGLELDDFTVRPSDAYDEVFRKIVEARADVVYVQPSLLRQSIIELALKLRLPLISQNRQFVESGGLLSYSAAPKDSWLQAVDYVDKIFKGRKPADLPVAFPTKFDLILNLKTAHVLGLTIPPSMLQRVDELIE